MIHTRPHTVTTDVKAYTTAPKLVCRSTGNTRRCQCPSPACDKLFPVGVCRTSLAAICFANGTKTWKSPGMGSGLKSPLHNTRRNKTHPAGRPEHRQQCQVSRLSISPFNYQYWWRSNPWKRIHGSVTTAVRDVSSTISATGTLPDLYQHHPLSCGCIIFWNTGLRRPSKRDIITHVGSLQHP
jgi:hypothetical protein